MGQTATGKLTEQRVMERLGKLGLVAYKPIPDRGVDIVAHFPHEEDHFIKIQVKGRNPKHDPNLRWFQVRVPAGQMKYAQDQGLGPDQMWKNKVNKVDFFVLDAVKLNEMWVLSRKDIYKLIELNAHQYGSRPDNIFSFRNPIKQYQKEMNLDVVVDGKPLTDTFSYCLDNFDLILDFLRV